MKAKLINTATVLSFLVIVGILTQFVTSKVCSKVRCDGMQKLGQRYQEVFKFDARRMGIEVK